ncbi:hypothetical protein SLS55_004422 [Diplodia seriata]|uniref:Methyltransferase domain-containing protein n=1 Tax=Diplodia seriata TaxID=420778 RepID=A0ABR3CJB2_9PEZI
MCAESESESAAAAQPQPATGPEVDPEYDDADSAFDSAGSVDDQLSTFSASLTSSVVAYPVQNGRRYHAYKDGSYILPNDEPEQDRLDLAHAMTTKLTGDRLHLTPLPEDFNGRVLDLGCGTGIWSICMGDQYPEAQILGNDLSPVQPSWVPPNVKFEIDDVENEWSHSQPFDYIFSRYLAGAIGDWPRLVRSAYANVKPGGWVEFQDYDSVYYSDDGTLTPEHDMKKWLDTLRQACLDAKRACDPGPRLEGYVKEAGCDVVDADAADADMSGWLKKQCGLMNLIQSLEGLEAFSYRIFTDMLRWEVDEVNVFLAKVRNDLKNKNIHAYYN